MHTSTHPSSRIHLGVVRTRLAAAGSACTLRNMHHTAQTADLAASALDAAETARVAAARLLDRYRDARRANDRKAAAELLDQIETALLMPVYAVGEG
jgi:hypothetical protein